MEHIQYFPPPFLHAYNTLYLDEDKQEKSKHKSREDQCVELFQKHILLNIALGAMFIEKSSFTNTGKDKVDVKV
jgi:hypothetical protein